MEDEGPPECEGRCISRKGAGSEACAWRQSVRLGAQYDLGSKMGGRGSGLGLGGTLGRKPAPNVAAAQCIGGVMGPFVRLCS